MLKSSKIAVANSKNPANLATCLAAAARDPLNLGPNEALDEAWQIVVEPALEHRSEHFAHQAFDHLGTLHRNGRGEGVEGSRNRGLGRGGSERLLLNRFLG